MAKGLLESYHTRKAPPGVPCEDMQIRGIELSFSEKKLANKCRCVGFFGLKKSV